MAKEPSGSDIRRAKSKAVGGGKKKCIGGKSCGATCIDRSKVCLSELSDVVSESLPKVSNLINETTNKGSPPVKPVATPSPAVKSRAEIPTDLRRKIASVNSEIAKQVEIARSTSDEIKLLQEELKSSKGAKRSRIQDEISNKNQTLGETRAKIEELIGNRDSVKNKLLSLNKSPQPPQPAAQLSKPSQPKPWGRDTYERLARKQIKNWEVEGDITADKIDWEDTLNKGRKIKGGDYGEVFILDKGRLGSSLPTGLPAGSYSGGVLLKKGEIGDFEPVAANELGKAGIGPRLVASRVSFEKRSNDPDSFYKGFMIMENLRGDALYKASAKNEMSELYDIYWTTKAKMHKLGYSHGDSHDGNFIIDDKGKGKFIDFGLSVKSYKNALSEGLGGPSGSDGQSAKRDGMVFNGIVKNFSKVKGAMLNDGFSDRQIKSFTQTGNAPQPLVSEPWQSMTEEQAQKYLNILYEGIG